MRRAEAVLRLMKADGRKGTKTTQVLKHLMTHKRGITPMVAFERYQLTRLGSVIFELRHKYGVSITTVNEVSEDGHAYARYILEEVEESA